MIKQSFCRFLPLFLLIFAALGCHQKVATPPLAIPEVVVEAVQVRDVQQYITTTGTTKAFEFVEITARVSGFLQETKYSTGDIVSAGAPLFLIQPEQYKAEVKSAEGVLAAAKAQLQLTEANLARTQRLFDANTSTKEDLDTATAQRDEAAAAVTQADAQLETAKLNLSYTDIRSPIAGKVGGSPDIGNMVGPGSHSILTTVVNMNPINVDFEISDSQFNRIQQYGRDHNHPAEVVAGGMKKHGIPVEISLIQGSDKGSGEYPFKGIISSTDNVLNVSTGTMKITGEIPNEDYAIFPGQICRVRVPDVTISDAVLVKQEAVGTSLNQRYVYVVDDQNIAHRRVIELGNKQPDGTRVVTKGLEAGERYVVSGIQKVRDGSEVKIK